MQTGRSAIFAVAAIALGALSASAVAQGFGFGANPYGFNAAPIYKPESLHDPTRAAGARRHCIGADRSAGGNCAPTGRGARGAKMRKRHPAS